MKWLFTGVFLLLFLFSFEPVMAQGLVTCSGPDCTFCSVVQLVDNIIQFVIILAIILATIGLAVAGVRLVVSQGNPAAVTAAKGTFFNVVIGIFIILIAWTLVDVVMKVLVGGQFGMWNEISSCGGQLQSGEAEFSPPPQREDLSGAAPQSEGIEVDPTTGEARILYFNDGGPSNSNSPGGGGSNNSPGGAPSGGGNNELSARSCDGANLATTNLFGHSVTVHRNLVPSVQRIDAAWRAQGNSRYQVTSVGGYNCRRIAGSSRWSVHSYGLAIDINPVQNPHRRDGVLITNMPPSFRQLFLSEGWGWGGNWDSSKDAMHFSKASNEGGNMQF